MQTTRRSITVRTAFRGIHCWPGCPHDEVAFLRHPHRHEFRVAVTVVVTGDDRELEFFLLQRGIDDVVAQEFGDEAIKELGSLSCEMVSDRIHRALQPTVECREVSICVSEDGENEAMATYPGHCVVDYASDMPPVEDFSTR